MGGCSVCVVGLSGRSGGIWVVDDDESGVGIAGYDVV